MRPILQLKIGAALLCVFTASTTALCADVEAGRAKVQQMCAECHRPSDWSGETQPALESLIKDIVSGKVSHSKRVLRLSDKDIADIAAYWASTHK